MSKRKKVFLSIIAVLLVIFIYVCVQNGVELFQSSCFYYRAYKGDRITINLTATIDGKPVKADDIEAKTAYLDRSEWNSVPVKDNGNDIIISIRANGYGDYHINVNICGYSFMLEAYQWNWWDVQNSNLYIHIDTKKNEYKTYEEYSHMSEECNIINESEPEATYEIGDINYISVGCKG